MLSWLGEALLDPACAACAAPLPFAERSAVCAACALGWHAPRTRETLPGIPELRALWDYAAAPRQLILLAKEQAAGAPAHALWSAARAQHPAALLPPARTLLIPAPSSRRRAQGALAEFLARRCAEHTGHRCCRWLRRKRRRPAQAGLAGAARRANLRDALGLRWGARWELAARRSEFPLRVWLVDDVATTGTTLIECARVLRTAGVQVAGALVLARVA